MKIKQTLKPRMIALLSLLFLSVASTFAHTVTINVDSGGQWRYRIYSYSSGSWSSWSSNSSAPQTIPVEDGDRLSLQASSTDSDTYYYLGWYEGETRRTTSTSYTVTITSDRNFTAKFTTETWTMTVINNGGGSLRIHNGAKWSPYFYGENATANVGKGETTCNRRSRPTAALRQAKNPSYPCPSEIIIGLDETMEMI